MIGLNQGNNIHVYNILLKWNATERERERVCRVL